MSWDFALILLLLFIVTGIVWCLDVFMFRKKRRQAGEAARAAIAPSLAGLPQAEREARSRKAYEDASKAPWWVEYCASFFPVILFVFALRSFIVEPFRIPSGSMLPTLQNGDLILVNKFEYGIRLPVIDKKIIPLGNPERGDVVVFRYPVDPDVDYIKRVIGVPGDEIIYRNKTLYVNGQEVPQTRDGDYFEPDNSTYIGRYTETMGDKSYEVLVNKRTNQSLMAITNFPYRENCQYAANGVQCKVPPGHYFMMGDNRDNSLDSRFWGFVPDSHIVGRAFFIWMNFSEPGRIGRFQ